MSSRLCVQTLEAEAKHMGGAAVGRKGRELERGWRRSRRRRRGRVFRAAAPPTVSFKSSLTLTTPKERKEARRYDRNLHFYVAKSINLY